MFRVSPDFEFRPSQPSISAMTGNHRITHFFKPPSIVPTPINGPAFPGTASAESLALDSRLPLRIFATDRYPDARLNVYSSPDILTVICDVLKDTEEMSILLDSCFGSLFSLRVSECPISCKLIHALLCRQLQSKQRYELWTVFGGQPLRFSLVEFGSVTGLPCGEFPEEYNPFSQPTPVNGENCYWDELIGDDRKATLADVSAKFQASAGKDKYYRLRLALLLIVDGVLISHSQIPRPTFKYVEMLKDIDSFLAFPWGRESFLKTISTMRPDKKLHHIPVLKKPRLHDRFCDPLTTFTDQLQQKTIRLTGFPLALQLLAYHNISGLLDKIPGSSDPRTFLDWGSIGLPKNNLPLFDIHAAERAPNVSIFPIVFQSYPYGLSSSYSMFCSVIIWI